MGKKTLCEKCQAASDKLKAWAIAADCQDGCNTITDKIISHEPFAAGGIVTTAGLVEAGKKPLETIIPLKDIEKLAISTAHINWKGTTAEKLAGLSLEERIEQQRGHYLYKQSEELHAAARERQLIKGAKTYPEPLEPDSWTPLQALNHLLEEVVDITQYATVQYIQNERLVAENKSLNEKVAALEAQAIEDKKQLKELEAAALRTIRKAFNYGR